MVSCYLIMRQVDRMVRGNNKKESDGGSILPLWSDVRLGK